MKTATVICQLCAIGDHHGKSTSDVGDSIDCSNCGKFRISHQTFNDFINNVHGRGEEQRALLAYLVRQRARPDEWIRVTPELVEQVYSGAVSFPSAIAQVENLVVWLAENVPQPGQAHRHRVSDIPGGDRLHEPADVYLGCALCDEPRLPERHRVWIEGELGAAEREPHADRLVVV